MKKILISLAVVLSLSTIVYANTAIDEKAATQLYYRTEIIAQKIPYTNKGFAYAVRSGNADLTEMFLKSGYNPNSKYLKLPMLFYAVFSGEPKVADLLLTYGAEVDATYLDQTALIAAIDRKEPGIVDVLIKHKADINRGDGAFTPLNYALKKKQPDVIESLLKAGAAPDDESLIRALKNKDANIKELVLKKYRELD